MFTRKTLLTLGVPAGVIFARSAVYVYSDKKRPVLQGLRNCLKVFANKFKKEL
jgi:hypothetical protein